MVNRARAFLIAQALFAISATAIAADIHGIQVGTWTLASSPYFVSGDVIIPEGQKLTIEPGVVIKVKGPFRITIDGILEARGTDENPIVFTSARDREFFGMIAPVPGTPSGDDWHGLIFTGKSAPATSYLRYVLIRYCRQPIQAAEASPILEKLRIEHSAATEITVDRQRFRIVPDGFADYYLAAENVLMEPGNVATTKAGDITPTRAFATLRGLVRDRTTRDPLPAVNVSLRPIGIEGVGARGTASGADGRFELTSLPPGRYEITASYITYADFQRTIDLQPGATGRIDIELTYMGLLLNPVTVTASRQPEAFLDVPATVANVTENELMLQQSLNPAHSIAGQPAVDQAMTGMNAAVTVVRGFNNVFSGSLLALVDNRIARAPALRVNALQFVPIDIEDYERVEVVLGPGSAIYGPNSANGVMHILTKSPFDSPGTVLRIGSGERAVFDLGVRHAQVVKEGLAIKVSGQYYRGDEWPDIDPVEQAARQAALNAGADASTLRIGVREPQFQRLALDGRVDLKLLDETTLILAGGFTQASNIELTGIGAAQLKDWRYTYGQARLFYRDLRVNMFVNQSNAGKTYLLRTGNPIIDKSQLFAGQLMHRYALNPRLHLTYGLDILLTRPHTGGTVNGRNERSDNIDEFGVHVQSKTDLSDKLQLVLAMRIDHHNRLEKSVWSPRSALIYRPTPSQSLHFTYNRAYSTPTSNHLFLDIMQERTASPLPLPLRQALDLREDIVNVRIMGVPSSTGFTFRYGDDGRALMRSQFDLSNDFSPATINAVWPKLRAVLVASNPQLDPVLPASISQDVPLVYLNPVTATSMPEPVEVEPIRETVTTTFEIGYKKLVGQALRLDFDVYRTQVQDFISPLMIITPTAHAVQSVLGPVLEQDIYNRLRAAGMNDAQARGTAQGVVAGIYDPTSPLNLERIPLGVAVPEQVADDNSIIATYRNFGQVWLTGADAQITYQVTPEWQLAANYSFVNHDLFIDIDGVTDLALNAPRHKFNIRAQYLPTNRRLAGRLQGRWVQGFPVLSGTYIGKVESYFIVDLAMSYRVIPQATVHLTVQNLFNTRHRQMVGAPVLGRLARLQLRMSL